MISPVDPYIEDFREAGADIITVHPEAGPHVHRTLQAVKASGAKAGLSLNPGTPVDALDNVIDLVDLILIMSVNPGFGGQSFIESVLPKIEAVRKTHRRHRPRHHPGSRWRRERQDRAARDRGGRNALWWRAPPCSPAIPRLRRQYPKA